LTLDRAAAERRNARRGREPALARWISIVGHPFVVTIALVVATALHFGGTREAIRTALLVAVVAILPIAVLMVRQVRRGAWGNVDASHRGERPLLFAVGLLALAALLGVLLVLRPDSFLVRGAAGVLAMLAVCAVATRWIKVSLHMAFAALAAVTLLALGSPSGWALLSILPPLAWSRLVLGRHRPAEVVVGLLLGGVFGYAIRHL